MLRVFCGRRGELCLGTGDREGSHRGVHNDGRVRACIRVLDGAQVGGGILELDLVSEGELGMHAARINIRKRVVVAKILDMVVFALVGVKSVDIRASSRSFFERDVVRVVMIGGGVRHGCKVKEVIKTEEEKNHNHCAKAR